MLVKQNVKLIMQIIIIIVKNALYAKIIFAIFVKELVIIQEKEKNVVFYQVYIIYFLLMDLHFAKIILNLKIF